MISLDKAKQLKKLGLEWEPQGGDFYFYPNGEFSGIFTLKCDPHVYPGKHMDCQTWLPRLSQMLNKIEDLGYWWLLRKDYCVIGKGKNVGDNVPGQKFNGDVLEDIIADALIFLLKYKRDQS